MQFQKIDNPKSLNLFPFAICLLVSTLHWITLPQTRIQLGGIDAYLYTSLSLDYKELLERFGTTYYASRVAAIFPMALFYKIFGLDHGFILLRILVSALTGFAFFYWLKSYWAWRPSLFFSCFLIISPWLSRELAWDYVTGFSVCYFICAISWLGAAKKGFLPVLAGIFLAAAVNTNFAAIPYILSFLACLFFIKKYKKEDYIKTLLSISLGFLSFYVFAGLIMWKIYPGWGLFFEGKTLETTLLLLKGGFEKWHRPIWEYLNNGSYYIFTPFLVCSCLIGIFQMQKFKVLKKSLLLSGSFLICSCLILLYLHNIKKGVVFMHHSFVYALPATYMGAAQILDSGKFQDLNWKKPWPWILLVVPFIILHSDFGRTNFFKYKDIITVLSLALLVIAPFLNVFRPGFIPACMFILSLTFLPLSALTHRPLLIGGDQKKEGDAIRIAQEVLKNIKNYAPHTKGKMAIWVPTPESEVIRSIASMNFWEYSMIYLKNSDGLPHVGEDAEEKLKTIRYLVLASEKGKGLIQEGLANLREASGKVWTPIYESSIQQESLIVYLAIVEKKISDSLKNEGRKTNTSFRVDRIRPKLNKENDSEQKPSLISIKSTIPLFRGKGHLQENRFIFETDPRLWANSASLAITERLPVGTHALVVKIKVERGQVQLYVMGDQVERTMPASSIVSAGAEEEVAVSILPEHTKNPRLVISNANPNGASQGEIISVRVLNAQEKRKDSLEQAQK